MLPLSAEQTAFLDDASLSNDERVAKLAEFALRSLGSDKNNAKYTNAIREEAKKLYPSIFDDIADATFNVYLSRAPGINPRVVSLGTARGYYYDPTEQSAIEEAPEYTDQFQAPAANLEEPPRYRMKEARLYSHVEAWLAANGYRAKVVAQGRTLGPWGNPDVVGIQTIDLLGVWQVQTVSIEVKVSNQNWQRDIFEAVSHRRYFDRSYFCYPVLANNRQISEELKDYAELYSIGILLVELAAPEFDKLARGEELDSDYLSITEAFPAPYSPVRPRYRKEAFNALQIEGLEALFKWGGLATKNYTDRYRP